MKNNKAFKLVVIILCVIAYLQVGFHFGTSFQEIRYATPETVWEKFIAGGWAWLSEPNAPMENRSSLSTSQLLFSFLWPVVLVFLILLSWAIFGIYSAFSWLGGIAWTAFQFLWWLIFTGGFGWFIATDTAPIFFFTLMLLSLIGLITNLPKTMGGKPKTAFRWFLLFSVVFVILLFLSRIF